MGWGGGGGGVNRSVLSRSQSHPYHPRTARDSADSTEGPIRFSNIAANIEQQCLDWIGTLSYSGVHLIATMPAMGM